MKKNKMLSMLVFTGALLLILIYIGDIGQLLENTTKNNNTIDLGVVNQCKPMQSTCSVSTQYQEKFLKLSFQFNQPIKPLQKFQASVWVNGLRQSEIQKVTIDYTMLGMDMGENKNTLKLIAAEEQLKTSWSSEGILPVCVTGRSDWLAIVTIMLDKQFITASFPFMVE